MRVTLKWRSGAKTRYSEDYFDNYVIDGQYDASDYNKLIDFLSLYRDEINTGQITKVVVHNG